MLSVRMNLVFMRRLNGQAVVEVAAGVIEKSCGKAGSLVDNSGVKLSIEEKNSKLKLRSKRSYVVSKLLCVSQIFRTERYEGYLPYQRPEGLGSPYLEVCASNGDRTKHSSKTGRLSVTKLLTKRWCELKTMYDIYSQMPIFACAQVYTGKKEHKRLEDHLHAVPKRIDNFIERLELPVPSDTLHKLAGEWMSCISRIITLLYKGEAREILCHRYIDSETGQLVNGPVVQGKDVLVSGIVDHIILTNSSLGGSLKPEPLSCTLREDNNYDIKSIIAAATELVDRRKTTLDAVIGDVKSRSTRTIPMHTNVLEAAKLQVMYYRNFMEALGREQESTYYKLIENAQLRNVNVDAPIALGKLLILAEIEPTIITDMRRMLNGEPIGFEPFDSYNRSKEVKSQYNYIEYKNKLSDSSTLKKYGEFLVNWKTPVTIRYLAARTAQMYGILHPILSDRLILEFYFGSDRFDVLSFKYNLSKLQTECTSSALFWFGKREPEPIEPNIKNITIYCKQCEYNTVCLWKKQSIENSKLLGQDLQLIMNYKGF